MPFTVEQFFEVFRAYNLAVWPAQWLLTLAGAVCVVAAASRRPAGGRIALLVLAGLWLWMAVAYHLAHFASVNPAAPIFAALFALGAALFARRALRSPAPRCELRRDARGVGGAALALFGLAVYPLLNRLFGDSFPAAPGFGLPCPTTIFTLGVLGWIRPHPERALLAVPMLWSFVGATAAVALDVPQDYVLALAGLWGIALAARWLRGDAEGPETAPGWGRRDRT